MPAASRAHPQLSAGMARSADAERTTDYENEAEA